MGQQTVVAGRGRLSGVLRSADARALTILLVVIFGFFAVILLQGRTFFEDDVENYYYPVLVRLLNSLGQGQLPLWTPTMFGGFPFLADGSAGTFYPLNWVALAFPREAAVMWLIALRTALGGVFLYAFVRALGLSPLASLLSALVYAFSGYTVGHWIHLSLSHSVLTLPLALFAVEKAHVALDRRRALLWLLLAGGANALLWLGVHPQAALISSAGVGLYGAFRVLATDERRRLVWRCSRLGVGAAVVGLITVGLAAAQLVPMAELSLFSVRAGGIPYSFASSFALPPHNLVTFFWPYAFVTPGGFDWGLTNRWETAIYVGVLPLALAALAVAARRERRVIFWAVLAFFALWLSFGRYVPVNLHYWAYQIPGFSIFRVPARFAMLTGLGLVVLAGYGLDLLISPARLASVSRPLRWIGGGLVVVALLGMATATATNLFAGTVAAYLWPLYTRWPRVAGWKVEQIMPALQQTWSVANPRFLLSGAVILVTAVLLAAWWRRPVERRPWLLVVVATLDLVLFAWPFWATAPFERLTAPPGAVAQYVIDKAGTDRVWSQRYTSTEPNHLIPFGVRDVNTYGPLASQRFNEYMALARYGGNRLLDLMAVRWVIAPLAQNLPLEAQGVRFDRHRPLAIVAPRASAPTPTFKMEKAFATRGIRLVGRLIGPGAAALPQGATAVDLVVRDGDGKALSLPVQAGVHVAEGDARRGDIAPKLGHELPTVAAADPFPGPDGKAYDRLLYIGTFDLPGAGFAVDELSFQSPAKGVGLEVFGLSLVGTDGTLLPSDRLTDTRFVERARDQRSRLLENLSPLPRVFLAGAAKVLPPNGRLLGALADEVTDPRAVVYLEQPPEAAILAASGPVGTAGVVADGDTVLKVAVDSPRPALLFVADPYYPGWRATVDGQAAPLYVANYIFRAVPVPAGKHEVTLTYAPASVQWGLWASGGTLALLLVAGAWLWRGRPQAS
ncbi:MAG: YfhO family protein [Chloroflexota bacterium]